MIYTVHKEGRPFRKCADLNEARECINENGGDGAEAVTAYVLTGIIRKQKDGEQWTIK